MSILKTKLGPALLSVVGVVIVLTVTAPVPQAQTGIAITFPTRLAAGMDYATDVLGDPWDMSNPEDIGLDPNEIVGWSNFSVSGGLAGGTTVQVNGTNDSSVSFLHRGFYGIINPGKNGRNFPIDPSVYQKLSFRLIDSAGGQRPHVYWFHNPWLDPAAPAGDPTGSGYGVRFMGDSSYRTAAGGNIIVADMTQSLNAGLPWTQGLIRGFRIDPNTFSSGQNMFFDWVRLTPNDNAPGAAMQTISWGSGGAGSATLQVIDADGTVLTIATGITGSSYNWYYGILPPGSYTLRVTRGSVVGTHAFTINNPPIIHVLDPDETGGEDYATTVLGNAWDMDSINDIQLTGFENFTGLSFSGGELHATNTNDDPQVTLLYNTNNSTPIDTSRYRYLTFKMRIDGAFNLSPPDGGSVARLVWGSQEFIQAGSATNTKDIVIWPGTSTYTIDLAALSTAPDGGLETIGAAQAWTAANVRHFRFDPHEYPVTRQFHIDDIKLAAVDRANGNFTIRWAASDLDTGDSPTVTLYYDTDRDGNNGRTQIATGLPAGQGQYSWSTTGVSPGLYYVYAEINDGVQTTGRYSTGRVDVVTPGAPVPNPHMGLSTPAAGATVTQPFALTGWAVDTGATSGSGVDAVAVYAVPSGGGAAIFVGSTNTFTARSDIAAAYGAQFTNSGFSVSVDGLSAGTYTLVAYAKSTVSGTYNQSANRSVTITTSTPVSNPLMTLESPANNTTVSSAFTLTGYAIDRGAPTGTGVDIVVAYAVPASGGATIFLGSASTFSARSDVGATHGARFTNSGYSIAASGLAPGQYTLVVYAHSTVSGTYNNSATATVTVAGSTPTPNPLMTLESPANNSTVPTSFTVAGYAIDRGATSGTGVDIVVAYAVPTAGGATIFLGSTSTFSARSDVGSTYGAQFTNSGYSITANGVPTGQYTVVVYAHSTVSGTYNNSAVSTVTVASATPTTNPLMTLESPANNATVPSSFTLSGYAIDRGSLSGSGVDIVVAYAVPASGGAAIFLGSASTFSARSDVGGTWGSRFTNSGYSIAASGLAAGQYTLVVYAHSTVSGTYNNSAVATVTVSTGGPAASDPLMSVDVPGQNTTVSQPFTIRGWALDRGASSGVGVDAVVVWAVPAAGGAATFVGGATLGGSRPDVAAFFGLSSQFNNSGYTLSASGLAAGTWDLVVYARSTVTGTYNQSKVVRVTIQ